MNALWYGIANFFNFFFGFYDIVGNVFNYSFIVLGFICLFYWLNYQRKFNKEAENNPNQIK